MINRMKRGFGTYEILTVFVMLLIIVVVLLAGVFKTDYKEKYAVMENNARMFSLTVANLYLEDGTQDVYYLQTIMDKRLLSNIKNPFKGDKYCDAFTSKVQIIDNKKYVTLECGNYLIYQQDSLDKPYSIYQVGSWSSKKPEGKVQETTFYNYQKNNKNGFSEGLEEDIFLYEFNKLNGTNYETIKDVPEKYHISKETMYRYMKKVN